jgi:hypothetical protein
VENQEPDYGVRSTPVASVLSELVVPLLDAGQLEFSSAKFNFSS